MQLKDVRKLFLGLNTDDDPQFLQQGEFTSALNVRVASSDQQHGTGVMQTLQGEIEVLIGVTGVQPTYYGGAIGGEFVYTAYAEVKIGDQVWMGKNWNAAYPNSKVYDNNEANRDIYGGLYTHNQAMSADFCPAGWRVPTEADIDVLLGYLGGEMIAGGKLKEPGTLHWDAPNTGAPGVTAFRALPGGKFDLLFSLLGSDGFFWLQDEGLETPLALPATVITTTSFFANWMSVTNADGYFLDVARDAAFTLMVSAYNNRDVGDVVTYPVAGLSDDQTYYYRIRAYEDAGESENSNIIILDTLVGEDVNYVILTDGVTSIRKGIRGVSFVVDITMTPTGFAGIENTDWKKIKDIVLAMGGGGGPLMDYDGNIYTTVIVGSQEWIVENLKVTHYADGTAIPNLTANGGWIADVIGAYCWYNNDIGYKEPYGALYNWYAVNNGHGLAYLERGGVQEAGWRVPTNIELAALVTYFGGDAIAGGPLKEVGNIHWNNNIGATNSSGLTFVGAGARNQANGNFEFIKEYSYNWSGNEQDAGYAYNLTINNYSIVVEVAPYCSKIRGVSVRLVRNYP